MSNKSVIGKNLGIEKPVIFKLSRRNESPATEGNFYPGIRRIPSTDQIFDPETNTNKIIRYSNSEESIFKEEQGDNIILSDIVFTRGSLKVYKDNPRLLKYLRLCNWNADNPNRMRGKEKMFYEYDGESIAQAALEELDLGIEAQYKAKNMEFDQLRSIARALKLDVDMSAKELRHDMVLYAKTYPKKFMTALSSPETARMIQVQEAQELGIIELAERMAYFVEKDGTKNEVVVIPVGVNPLDYFVGWTMTTKEGEEFFEGVIKKRDSMLS
jgi:hypothetical protein